MHKFINNILNNYLVLITATQEKQTHQFHYKQIELMFPEDILQQSRVLPSCMNPSIGGTRGGQHPKERHHRGHHTRDNSEGSYETIDTPENTGESYVTVDNTGSSYVSVDAPESARRCWS